MDQFTIYLSGALIAGIIIGLIIGFIIGKKKSEKTDDSQTDLRNLDKEMSNLRIKFDEVEKARADYEDLRRKYDEERDKRLNELIENTGAFFKEQKDTREEIEKKRDNQLENMGIMINKFTRTVAGTKTRGNVAEDQVKDILCNSIQVGIIKTNLKTDNGEVEFAWNLEDGKYIPIDCKFPDVIDLIDRYDTAENTDEQRAIKKQISGKVKTEINRIKKYQNLSNTIDSCILLLPDGILEVSPEIVDIGKENGVYVCGFTQVFPVAHTLSDKYHHIKRQGDIGLYRQMANQMLHILDNIRKKADSIERAITTINNANKSIQNEVAKGNRELYNIDRLDALEEDETEEQEADQD